MAEAFQTIQFVVTFRRGPGELPEQEIKNTKEAAYALAVQIELHGGIALVVQTPKQEPLARLVLPFEGE